MKSPKWKGNVVIKSDHPFTSKFFWAYVRRWQTELTLSDWHFPTKKSSGNTKEPQKVEPFIRFEICLADFFLPQAKKPVFFNGQIFIGGVCLEQTIFFWRARSSIFLLIPFVKVERTQQISRRFLPPRHFVSSLHFNQTDNSSTIRS